MSSSYLYDLASELLLVAEDALDSGRTGNPEPERVFVSWGQPVADQCCENGGQLTVHLAGFNEDGFGIEHTQNKCWVKGRAHYWITLLRCHPVQTTNQPIPMDELERASEGLFRDMWALVNGITSDWPTAVAADCQQIEMGPVKLITPQGGCAGLSVELILELVDPAPVGS